MNDYYSPSAITVVLYLASVGLSLIAGYLVAEQRINSLPVYIVTVEKGNTIDTGVTNRLEYCSDGTVAYYELKNRVQHTFSVTDKYTVEEITDNNTNNK